MQYGSSAESPENATSAQLLLRCDGFLYSEMSVEVINAPANKDQGVCIERSLTLTTTLADADDDLLAFLVIYGLSHTTENE